LRARRRAAAASFPARSTTCLGAAQNISRPRGRGAGARARSTASSSPPRRICQRAAAGAKTLENIAKTGDNILEAMQRVTRQYEELGL
jgi:hypothetical protein